MHTHQAPPFQLGSSNSAVRFLLQDSRGNTGDNLMFWAQSGGYTSNLALAQHFEDEAAFRQHESRESDVPWPVAYLQQHTHRVVDCQQLDVEEARIWANQTRFHRQSKAHRYVGNDLVFLAANGKTFTVDLDAAKVFTASEVESFEDSSSNGMFWPKRYLDAKSRIAANSTRCKVADALKGTGRKLIVPKRAAPAPYRCHTCNVFLKATAFYGDCPRCGADNRP